MWGMAAAGADGPLLPALTPPNETIFEHFSFISPPLEINDCARKYGSVLIFAVCGEHKNLQQVARFKLKYNIYLPAEI